MEQMNRACVYCSRPVSSRKPRQNNVLLSALHVIDRYALKGQGAVGSLYDAWADYLLPNLSVNQNAILRRDHQETPDCKLIKVDRSNRDNLLKLIDIEDELRVSIALGIAQFTEGTLTLSNCVLPADRNIRFIDYYHIDQEECLSDDIQVARNTLPHSLPNGSATHIITSVRKGIDFVIVLELTEDENPDEIDSILEQLRVYFIKSTADFISTKDEQKLNRLKPTIFTQSTHIRSLAENKNLSDICQGIHTYIYRDRDNIALSYTLHPIKCIYCDNLYENRTFCQSDPTIIQKIEEKILPLYNRVKTAEHLFYHNVPPDLRQYFESWIAKICEQVIQVKNMYTDVQHSLAEIITEFRRGKPNIPSLDSQLNGTKMKKLHSELENLESTMLKLQTKTSFIAELKRKYNMEYVNVAQFEDSNDDKESLEGKLFSLNQEKHNCYLCSTDELIEKDSDQHDKLCQANSSLHPVFADFSYCAFKLDAMRIFQPPVPSMTTSSAIKPNEINILLIGETGVGKSTFINAFVNYLVFHSLTDAKNRDPIVLIPVSFAITIGDQFEEKTINFGQCDSNEDHNRTGQSVTQHCKSYIFNIDNNTKLRIIDTPGVGDTRGVEQDDKNIEHILSYINNLPHLNAICFLLKPNTTRLNVFFRSCFMQLFNFLGPNVRENVIFCFTNTRATFYTPGNTTPLLKEMLRELPNGDTCAFAKENTFCFDSESFRYLAVIKATNEMVFDENQIQDFEKSWIISVTESIRLLDFVKNRSIQPFNKLHSIKHAELMITWLVRPILETIRNVLRNLVLKDMKDNKHTIEMEVQPLTRPASFCRTCPCDIIQIGDISIVKNSVHESRTLGECTTCHCNSNDHLPVFYELKHHLSDAKIVLNYLTMEKTKDRLVHNILKMSQFLIHIAHISQNPFLSWFDLLVQEEQHANSKEERCLFHVKLYNIIFNLKKNYEKSLNENKFDQKYINLDAIYECIEEVLTYPMVAKQMKTISTCQMEMMKDQEYDVSSQHPHIDVTVLQTYFVTDDG
jgi:GTP-binding protein EngB required for normal cell division